MNSSRRVFIGTRNIAGYYSSLYHALRRRGVDVTYVNLMPHRFTYEEPDPPTLTVRLIRYVNSLDRRIRRYPRFPGLALRVLAYLLSLPLRLLMVAWCARRFDVFILGFGKNILGEGWGYLDLRLLRFLGKRIICPFHGSDSRPPYLDGKWVHTAGCHDLRRLRRVTQRRRRRVQHLERIAEICIDNPFHAHFRKRRFVDHFMMGLPAPPLHRCNEEEGRRRDVGVTVLHAPSFPEGKGTELIRHCIRTLQLEGLEISYVEIAGRPHQEVCEAICRADVVVDQAYSDTPMAGFALEAAAAGKPVLVGGYLGARAEKLGLPTAYCEPDDMMEALRELCLSDARRERLGAAARAFAGGEWSSDRVAERYLRLIEGCVPEEWYRDPGETDYVGGWGLEQKIAKDCVGAMVRKYGGSALGVDHNPTLKGRLLSFAGLS